MTDSPIPRSEPSLGVPLLIGREREQTTLRMALDAALEGHGRLVLIGGEAGIGKTTLLTWLAAEADARGAQVVSGGCYDLSLTPPYGPWAEVTDNWPADALTQPPTVLRGTDALAQVGSQYALFELVGDFFAQAGESRPLVVLLEDLHWADQASLDLLRYLARRVHRYRMLLVVTWRDDEITRRHPLFGLLPALARESSVERFTLQRLDSARVRELVAGRYPLPIEECERLATYLQRVTEGNPFFVDEVLRSLEEGGALRRVGEDWQLDHLDKVQVPTLVRQVIETRLNRLGADARELLQVAAVIGHEVPVELWIVASGADEEQLAAVLEAAGEARIIEEMRGGMQFTFTHALTRETLYDGLVSIRRRAWHRKIAEVLERNPRPDPDEVAHHYLQLHDQRAVDWLVRAANRAEASYARISAVERLETAGALLADDEVRAAERGWLLMRIPVLVRTSDPRKGLTYCNVVEQIAIEVGDLLLRSLAIGNRATAYSYVGDARQALATYEAQQTIVAGLSAEDVERTFRLRRDFTFDRDATINGVEIERTLRSLGAKPWINSILLPLFLARAGRLQEALTIGQGLVATYEAVAPGLTRRSWAHYLASEPLGALGYAHAALGRPEEARDALQRSRHYLQIADERYVYYQRLGTELQHVVMPYATDDLAERQRLAVALRDARTSAAGGVLGAGVPWLEGHLMVAGAWDEAHIDAGAALRSTLHPMEKIAARVTLAWIAVLRGLPSPMSWVDGLLPDGPETDVLHGLEIQRMQASVALDAADMAATATWLAAHDRWLAQTGIVLGGVEGLVLWSRYYQQAGELERAESSARQALEQARQPRQPLALLGAQRQLGAVLTAVGHFDEGRHWLAEALADACAAPFERALTLLALAELQAHTGDHEPLPVLLTEVRALCIPLDARPTLARLAVLEVRLGTQQPRATRPAGLTVRELEVLQFVTQGLTDAEVAERLFLSPRTVGTHLTSIYTKLGVSSRMAAARKATELGLG